MQTRLCRGLERPYLQMTASPMEDRGIAGVAAIELCDLQHSCRLAAGLVSKDWQEDGGAHVAGFGILCPQIDADAALLYIV